MRFQFDQQLELLNTQLIKMGELCEMAIDRSTTAMLNGDKVLASQAISFDEEIDQKEREIEGLCLKLLLQQQPVARDLRQISSALKMITDMERIGDQAADIAEIVALADVSDYSSTLHIGKMAEATIKMVTESIDAFVQKDLELARAVMDYDDVVDRLFDEVKLELIDLIKDNSDNGQFAIDLLMIAKYFERIGDHATNIAEWVEFSLTGKHKNGMVDKNAAEENGDK